MSDPWDDTPEPREAAVNFEAVKIAMSQTKDGMILKLAIHPDDIPDSVVRDWVGSRYTVAMVKMDDDNTPIVPPQRRVSDKVVTTAVMLCKNEKFWKYLEGVCGDLPKKHVLHNQFPENEEEARLWIVTYCEIESRKELRDNTKARTKFLGLVGDFEHWMKH